MVGSMAAEITITFPFVELEYRKLIGQGYDGVIPFSGESFYYSSKKAEKLKEVQSVLDLPEWKNVKSSIASWLHLKVVWK